MTTRPESLGINPDDVERILDIPVVHVASILVDFEDKRDLDGLMAFRLRYLNELIEIAEEMSVPDRRIRRIRGEQWKLGVKVASMPKQDALRHLSQRFWTGTELMKEDFS